MDFIKNGKLLKFDSLHYSLFDISVEFMKIYIYESNQKKLILDNLQNLYVYVVNFDERFKNIIDNNSYKMLKKHNNYIIGFILVNNKINNIVQYINYIDTRIKKHNLAKYMIELYEKQYNIILIPYDILETASRYWKKYFEEKYNILTLSELKMLKEKLEIKDQLHWKFLMDLYELK